MLIFCDNTEIKMMVDGWGYRVHFHPGVADFGHLIEGAKYQINVKLQNAGYAKLRFKVFAPSDQNLQVQYRIGPLAAGLATDLKIIFTATGGVLREDGIYGIFQIFESLKSINNSDYVNELEVKKPFGPDPTDQIIKLPVIARIIPASEVERLKILRKPTERLNRNVKRIK